MSIIPDRLRTSREKKKVNQRTLAEVVGVTEFQISRWEHGKADTSISNLLVLSDYLGVSTDYLLGRSDNETRKLVDDLSLDEQRLLRAYSAGDTVTMLEIVTARVREIVEGSESG